jgi:predicted nuclease of predicted toxin-antitoxin system
VRLLFDQNLSPRLVTRLVDLFPGSAHVQDLGLSQASDASVADFWRTGRLYILVSEDSDFFEPALLRGHAAKIVWIRRGNCSTAEIENILRRHTGEITQLARTEKLYLLMLY